MHSNHRNVKLLFKFHFLVRLETIALYPLQARTLVAYLDHMLQ